MAEFSEGRLERLKRVGVPVYALNDQLVRQLDLLDDDEIRAIVSIKEKLNSGLDERLKEAADVVGGFVW
jgi:hypothetical protein